MLYAEIVFAVVVVGLIPASFAACVVVIHIIWVLVRDLIQENVDLSFWLGQFRSKPDVIWSLVLWFFGMRHVTCDYSEMRL